MGVCTEVGVSVRGIGLGVTSEAAVFVGRMGVGAAGWVWVEVGTGLIVEVAGCPQEMSSVRMNIIAK